MRYNKVASTIGTIQVLSTVQYLIYFLNYLDLYIPAFLQSFHRGRIREADIWTSYYKILVDFNGFFDIC